MAWVDRVQPASVANSLNLWFVGGVGPGAYSHMVWLDHIWESGAICWGWQQPDDRSAAAYAWTILSCHGEGSLLPIQVGEGEGLAMITEVDQDTRFRIVQLQMHGVNFNHLWCSPFC